MHGSPFLLLAILLIASGLMGCRAGAPQPGQDPVTANAQGDPPPAPDSAEAFLGWSMDRYSAATSFKADCDWSMTTAGEPTTGGSKRTLVYERPNRFKVISGSRNTFVQTCVSDGTKLVEYANQGGMPASSYPAPTSISDAASMQMKHPMFCGSLLYQFFGGSANLDGLASKDKGPIAFGAEKRLSNGADVREVKFYGTGSYGHVSALIDKKTGLVYEISYDSEPLMQMMATKENQDMIKAAIKQQIASEPPGPKRDSMEKSLADVGKPVQSVTTERYVEPLFGAHLTAADFDTTVPKDLAVQDMPTMPSDKPPVPLGHPAPEFQVTTLKGEPVTLSSLKGSVVMIDFWATWCGPCREGLPETNRLANAGAGRNLKVMAVSSEDASTVEAFLKSKGYTMPGYLDPGGKAQSIYSVNGIPTTVVIDAKGTLVAYMVGLHPKSDILAALKKAGADVD